MPTQDFVCAGWSEDADSCKNVAKYSCKGCFLVAYCGPECQKSHWTEHKIQCKSIIGKKTWQPLWASENRCPTFLEDGAATWFGIQRYLWASTPAIDVLQLKRNEGVDNKYSGDLNLLFADSKDLRSVVKTVSNIPKDNDRKVNVTLNDHDFDIAARNIILFLIALDTGDVDCMIHTWYSALIRQSDMDVLQKRVRTLIQEVCNKIRHKNPRSILRKSWQFGNCTLTVMLQKADWDRLLALFEPRPSLTREAANSARRALTLAPTRQDWRDFLMTLQTPPSHRIAFQRFREEGILLPFGSRRHEFCLPNPTLYDDADAWPMMDESDPLNGWSRQDVRNTPCGPATADLYGKLFYYLRSAFRGFVKILGEKPLSFKVLHIDAERLPHLLGGERFCRIETSNIADQFSLGVHKTLSSMVPLLQPPSQNPHATLITLFANAIRQHSTAQDEIMFMTDLRIIRDLQYFMSPDRIPPPLSGSSDPVYVRIIGSFGLVGKYDYVFSRYMTTMRFDAAARISGAAMKGVHTVVPEWPGRVSLPQGQPGAQEEFDAKASGSLNGKERYVEWRRMSEDEIK